MLTWFCNADSDISPLKLGSTKIECFFQAFECSKLYVTETFRLAVELVFHDPDACNFASRKVIFNVCHGHVKGEIAKMCGIWRPCGKRKGFSGWSSVCSCQQAVDLDQDPVSSLT